MSRQSPCWVVQEGEVKRGGRRERGKKKRWDLKQKLTAKSILSMIVKSQGGP
jgi:hypothetical protein